MKQALERGECLSDSENISGHAEEVEGKMQTNRGKKEKQAKYSCSWAAYWNRVEQNKVDNIMTGCLWNRLLDARTCWKTIRNQLSRHIHLGCGANYTEHGFGSWCQKWRVQNWLHDKQSTSAVALSCWIVEHNLAPVSFQIGDIYNIQDRIIQDMC